MIESERSMHWIIVEAGDRWYRAVLRFSIAWQPGAPSVTAHRVGIAEARELSKRHPGSVLLWEWCSQPGAIADAVQCMGSVRVARPSVLLVATTAPWACDADRLALAEAGVSIWIDDIESIARLAPLWRKHWQSAAGR